MANPNILTASSVVGITTLKRSTDGRLKTRSTDTNSDYYTQNIVIYNPASSGKLFKITDIIIINTSNGSREFSVRLVLHLDDPNNSRFTVLANPTTSGQFFIIDANNKVGLANSSFPVNNHFYLAENQGIEVAVNDAFGSDAFDTLIQYEEITA
jgi:hypothetical protein